MKCGGPECDAELLGPCYMCKKPPSIELSTRKVLKFRPFALTLVMGRDYARAYTVQDVYDALTHAHCCLETDPRTAVASCFCCPDRPVIEFAARSAADFGPRLTPDGLAVYTLAACRAHCSSSRDHRLSLAPAKAMRLPFHRVFVLFFPDKSKLLVVVDGLRGVGPLYTAPFVIQAREKKRSPTLAVVHAPDALPVPPDALPPPQPGMYDAHGHLLPMTLPAAPPAPAAAAAAVTAAAAAAARAAGPAFLAFVQQRSTDAAAEICRMSTSSAFPVFPLTARTAAFSAHAPHAVAQIADGASDGEHDDDGAVAAAAAAVPHAPGLAAVVRVYATQLALPDIECLCQEVHGLLARQCGFVDHRWVALPGFLVTFTFFRTPDQVCGSSALSLKYCQNVVPNVWDCDLVGTHICVLLSTCTNFQYKAGSP